MRVWHWPAEAVSEAAAYVLSLPREDLDEYANPFESKLQVPKRLHGEPALARVFHDLKARWFSLNLSAEFAFFGMKPDPTGYFEGIFLYRPGDYLQMHRDSAIHEGWRKVITANLYLTACEGGVLRVGPQAGPFEECAAEPGTLAVFANDDENAYHEVTPVTGGERVMVTMGYVLPRAQFPIAGFREVNTRAVFVPGPGEVWTPEQYRLSEERAGMRAMA